MFRNTVKAIARALVVSIIVILPELVEVEINVGVEVEIEVTLS